MTKPFGQDLHRLMRSVRANGKDGFVLPGMTANGTDGIRLPLDVTADGTNGINIGESRFSAPTGPGLISRLWARLRRTA